MLELRVHAETPEQPDEFRIERLVAATLTAEQRQLRHLSVSFVEPETIRRFNREQRGRDAATDILSYPFDDSFPGGPGGELLVCPAVARQSADAEGRGLRAVIDELIVHGTLHLLGHEDDSEPGRQAMARRTAAVLATVGETARG